MLARPSAASFRSHQRSAPALIEKEENALVLVSYAVAPARLIGVAAGRPARRFPGASWPAAAWPKGRRTARAEEAQVSDAVIFAIIFVGFFVLRLIAGTVFFLYLLPTGDRCPNCDAPTLHVRSRGWNLLMPWFRTSWCTVCGWEGLLRKGPLTEQPVVQGVEGRKSKV